MWESCNDSLDVCHCSRLLRDCNVDDSHNVFCNSLCNKENLNQRLDNCVKNDVELSLYENISPRSELLSSSDFSRRPLLDRDTNSQDSGYGRSSFSISDEHSTSVTSIDLLSDDFIDLSDMSPLDENSQLPGDFNKLINGKIQFSIENKKVFPEKELSFRRPLLKKSISFNLENVSHTTSGVRSCLFFNNDNKSFKRPSPPTDVSSPREIKRYKITEENIGVPFVLSKPILQRSVSVSEDVIKSALQRSCSDSDLIGDFSKSFGLPLVNGKHPDLKSINCSTLAALIDGRYSDKILSYKIIDCRYPYEYEGGHIKGAHNIYTKNQILEKLLAVDQIPSNTNKRNILIFHCEFSSERGPNLYRFLRKFDRQRNNEVYPLLHYPEIYLLEGGYKFFYEQYANLCTPQAYKPMLHPEHKDDLRHFRAKAKSCNVDKFNTNKESSKRSRLFM